MANSFTATDSHSAETHTWLTPKWLLDELGEFDMDPCAAPDPRPFPTAKRMNTLKQGDGLAIEWEGRVWLNPPYDADANRWIQKLEHHGDGIALVFARTDTIWMQALLSRHGAFFLKGRVKFLRPDGSEPSNGPGAASLLLPFGRSNIGRILASKLEGVWMS